MHHRIKSIDYCSGQIEILIAIPVGVWKSCDMRIWWRARILQWVISLDYWLTGNIFIDNKPMIPLSAFILISKLITSCSLNYQSLLFIDESYPVNTLAEFRFQQRGSETIIERLFPVVNVTSTYRTWSLACSRTLACQVTFSSDFASNNVYPKAYFPTSLPYVSLFDSMRSPASSTFFHWWIVIVPVLVYFPNLITSFHRSTWSPFPEYNAGHPSRIN